MKIGTGWRLNWSCIFSFRGYFWCCLRRDMKKKATTLSKNKKNTRNVLMSEGGSGRVSFSPSVRQLTQSCAADQGPTLSIFSLSLSCLHCGESSSPFPFAEWKRVIASHCSVATISGGAAARNPHAASLLKWIYKAAAHWGRRKLAS